MVVPEHSSAGSRPPKPGIVDVVPVELVEPLIARHEEELRALRLELEQALREADEAEHRLNTHPAAAVYDETFEAEVLAHVARSVATVEHRPDTVTTPGLSEAMRSAPVNTGGGVAPRPVLSPDTPVIPRVEPPTRAPGSPPTPGPRTVVVDRSRPRTVVVDRSRPVAEAPPSAPPPTGPSAAMSDTGADTYITVTGTREPLLEVDRKGPDGIGGPPKRRSGRTTKIPARLLIQTGVVIVIVALLLLKLG
jgi:hypothetical protein